MEQVDRREIDQGGAHEAHRESVHPGPGQRERDAAKAKEEVVKKVAESMHECSQHKR